MAAEPASKVRNGTFKLGGLTGPAWTGAVEFACDPTTIKITPKNDKDGDDLEVLCGDTIPAGRKRSFTVNGDAVQHFDDEEGFQAYCYEHDSEQVHFQLEFNDGSSPKYEGTITIVALEEGGDVGGNPGTVAFSFEGVGWYTRTAAA